MLINHISLELRVFKNCYLETASDYDNVHRDYYKGFLDLSRVSNT